MNPNKRIRRERIDYEPGPAGREALKVAQTRFHGLSLSALIDMLIVNGLSARLHQHWVAPALHGKDRDKWTMPPSLRE